MTREEIVAGAAAAIDAGSKSFRAASRLFDRTTRERSWLLYCWCRHCDDVCDGQMLGRGQGSRGSVAQLRDKTERAAAGEHLGELPFEALRQLMSERPVPLEYLRDHIQGFELDEQGWRPWSEADLERYCYHVAGAVGCMMAIVMGVPAGDTDTLKRAADLGIAFQLSNICRDVREDLGAGRCYLPAEWLAEFGLDPEALFDPAHEVALLIMIDRLLAAAVRRERSARIGARRLPFRSRVAILSALRIYGAIGRRVGRLGSRAWDGRVTIGRSRKLALLVPSVAEAMIMGRAA